MNDDFNENNASFYLLSLVHCKYAAMLSALIGILCVVALFAVSVVHFEWYLYETVIDAVTLGGFGLFLLSGVAVHYAVLYAIQTTKTALRHVPRSALSFMLTKRETFEVKFMNPFLIFHTFSVILEVIIALTAVGELVSNQSAYIEERNKIARVVILSIPFCICAQLAMIYSVVKCKAYVKRKANHLLRIRSSQVGIFAYRKEMFPT
uniref:Uncharacterized protein n=1 Tax=Ascaris lumbricoides TaxID=6252 RepID=A0A0M3HZU9_ASCLU